MCFSVIFTPHRMIVAGIMVYPLVSVPLSGSTTFPDNSSYSFHGIMLKFGGHLDHEEVQHIVLKLQ